MSDVVGKTREVRNVGGAAKGHVRLVTDRNKDTGKREGDYRQHRISTMSVSHVPDKGACVSPDPKDQLRAILKTKARPSTKTKRFLREWTPAGQDSRGSRRSGSPTRTPFSPVITDRRTTKQTHGTYTWGDTPAKLLLAQGQKDVGYARRHRRERDRMRHKVYANRSPAELDYMSHNEAIRIGEATMVGAEEETLAPSTRGSMGFGLTPGSPGSPGFGLGSTFPMSPGFGAVPEDDHEYGTPTSGMDGFAEEKVGAGTSTQASGFGDSLEWTGARAGVGTATAAATDTGTSRIGSSPDVPPSRKTVRFGSQHRRTTPPATPVRLHTPLTGSSRSPPSRSNTLSRTSPSRLGSPTRKSSPSRTSPTRTLQSPPRTSPTRSSSPMRGTTRRGTAHTSERGRSPTRRRSVNAGASMMDSLALETLGKQSSNYEERLERAMATVSLGASRSRPGTAADTVVDTSNKESLSRMERALLKSVELGSPSFVPSMLPRTFEIFANGRTADETRKHLREIQLGIVQGEIKRGSDDYAFFNLYDKRAKARRLPDSKTRPLQMDKQAAHLRMLEMESLVGLSAHDVVLNEQLVEEEEERRELRVRHGSITKIDPPPMHPDTELFSPDLKEGGFLPPNTQIEEVDEEFLSSSDSGSNFDLDGDRDGVMETDVEDFSSEEEVPVKRGLLARLFRTLSTDPEVKKQKGKKKSKRPRRSSIKGGRRRSMTKERRSSATGDSTTGERRGSVTRERRGSLSTERRGLLSRERRGSMSRERRGSLSRERRSSLSRERRASLSRERGGSVGKESTLRRSSTTSDRRSSVTGSKVQRASMTGSELLPALATPVKQVPAEPPMAPGSAAKALRDSRSVAPPPVPSRPDIEKVIKEVGEGTKLPLTVKYGDPSVPPVKLHRDYIKPGYADRRVPPVVPEKKYDVQDDGLIERFKRRAQVELINNKRNAVAIDEKLEEAVEDMGLSNKHLKKLRLAFLTCKFRIEEGQREIEEMREMAANFDILSSDMGLLKFRIFQEYLKVAPCQLYDMIFLQLMGDSPSTHTNTLTLIQFLRVTFKLCIATREDLLQLLFNIFDEEQMGVITDPQFILMAELLHGADANFKGNIEKAKQVFSIEGDAIDFDGFIELNRKNAMILFPAFQLQHNLQRRTLGSRTWKRVGERTRHDVYVQRYKDTHGGLEPPDAGTAYTMWRKFTNVLNPRSLLAPKPIGRYHINTFVLRDEDDEVGADDAEAASRKKNADEIILAQERAADAAAEEVKMEEEQKQLEIIADRAARKEAHEKIKGIERKTKKTGFAKRLAEADAAVDPRPMMKLVKPFQAPFRDDGTTPASRALERFAASRREKRQRGRRRSSVKADAPLPSHAAEHIVYKEWYD